MFTLGEVDMIGTIKSSEFTKFLRGTTFDNRQLVAYATRVLPMSQAEQLMLWSVTTMMMNSGASIVDNSYLYFKAFINIFARARTVQYARNSAHSAQSHFMIDIVVIVLTDESCILIRFQ